MNTWTNPMLHSPYDYVDSTTGERRVNDSVLRSLFISLGQEINRLNKEIEAVKKKVAK